MYNQNLTFIKRINFESLRSLTHRDREEYSIKKTRLNCLSKSISEHSIILEDKLNTFWTYSNINRSINQSINRIYFWTELGSEPLILLHYSIRLELHKQRSFVSKPMTIANTRIVRKVYCWDHNSPQTIFIVRRMNSVHIPNLSYLISILILYSHLHLHLPRSLFLSSFSAKMLKSSSYTPTYAYIFHLVSSF